MWVSLESMLLILNICHYPCYYPGLAEEVQHCLLIPQSLPFSLHARLLQHGGTHFKARAPQQPSLRNQCGADDRKNSSRTGERRRCPCVSPSQLEKWSSLTETRRRLFTPRQQDGGAGDNFASRCSWCCWCSVWCFLLLHPSALHHAFSCLEEAATKQRKDFKVSSCSYMRNDQTSSHLTPHPSVLGAIIWTWWRF